MEGGFCSSSNSIFSFSRSRFRFGRFVFSFLILLSLSDDEFWELLRSNADAEGLQAMKRLEEEGLPEEDGLGLPRAAKVRTLDPDVWLRSTHEALPLSVVRAEWVRK